jgi:hypothetical protein
MFGGFSDGPPLALEAATPANVAPATAAKAVAAITSIREARVFNMTSCLS